MARLDRLERVTDLLLVLLDTPRPLSLRQIADRVPGYPEPHSARRQAFERDKRLLRDEGIPVLAENVEGHDQVGYRVDPDAYYLPDLGLDAAEQAALNLAVAGVHLGAPAGRQALSKLGATPGLARIGAGSQPVVNLPPLSELPALPLLYDAVRQAATVTFGYRGASREVDPSGIRFRSGHWYLLGIDRQRGAPRTFRVDRVEGLPEIGEASSARFPEGFDPGAAFSFDPWQYGSGEEVDVDILVDGVEAGRVVAELGATSVVETRDDGAVVVRVGVSDIESFVTWVLGLLHHAQVLSPPEVIRAVVDRLEAIVAAGPVGSR